MLKKASLIILITLLFSCKNEESQTNKLETVREVIQLSFHENTSTLITYPNGKSRHLLSKDLTTERLNLAIKNQNKHILNFIWKVPKQTEIELVAHSNTNNVSIDIPAVRLKRDFIPNMRYLTSFTINKEGYYLFDYSINGKKFTSAIQALSEEDYKAFLETLP